MILILLEHFVTQCVSFCCDNNSAEIFCNSTPFFFCYMRHSVLCEDEYYGSRMNDLIFSVMLKKIKKRPFYSAAII